MITFIISFGHLHLLACTKQSLSGAAEKRQEVLQTSQAGYIICLQTLNHELQETDRLFNKCAYIL